MKQAITKDKGFWITKLIKQFYSYQNLKGQKRHQEFFLKQACFEAEH